MSFGSLLLVEHKSQLSSVACRFIVVLLVACYMFQVQLQNEMMAGNPVSIYIAHQRAN